MRGVTIGLLMGWMSGAALAQTVQRIDVLDYGLYCVTQTSETPDAGAVSGRTMVVKNTELAAATRTVPARVGVDFGFHFKIVGEPNGATVQVKKVTHVPHPGIRNPQGGSARLRGEILSSEKIGQVGYKGYGFDDAWEVVAGTWTFELWVGDKMFVSQSFDAVTPSGARAGDLPPARHDGCVQVSEIN